MSSFILKIAAFLMDFVETIITALLFFIIIYLFLFQPHQVKGNSMHPSFEDNEYLLTNKITYRFKDPQRGEVVIFKAPPKKEYDYIKRIIGLPNDTIMINDGKVYINGALLDESDYLDENIYTQPGAFSSEDEEIIIPANHYFVIGDNRTHSNDSREWGYIEKEDIIGKAWLSYWPPSKFGLIPTIAW